jgi:nicotinate dehydrogenase subunit B
MDVLRLIKSEHSYGHKRPPLLQETIEGRKLGESVAIDQGAKPIQVSFYPDSDERKGRTHGKSRSPPPAGSGQPYQFSNVRVNTRHVAEAFFRSSHLRSPGRIENSFANEGFMDELAAAAKADPAQYRLRYLKDQRAIDVVQAAMKLANWQARPGPNPDAGSGPVVKGRGIAYLRYNNAITYVAAVAEVEVNKDTGEIRVTRVCVSHDCGEMVNPNGVANQVEGGVLQTVSRTLMEAVSWDRNKVTSVDWVSYPIMRHTQAPKVEVALIDRPGQVAWGAGEPTACAIPAAIANAVFDATGARLRSVPLTPDKVKAALAGLPPQRG